MALTPLNLKVIISAVDKLTAPLKGLGGSVGGLEKRLRAADAAAGAFNTRWAKTIQLGQTVGAGLAVAGAAIMALNYKAVQAASSVTEAENKVSAVFHEQADVIKEWSRDSATALGQSRLEALMAAGTYGNLFTSMGLARDMSAEMSMRLVELASDLASFNDIDPTVALEKLRSGLVGETEPLRQLGVNLYEAQVQTKALEMGLGDASGQVTFAAKVQARYALILEQTTNAEGDFARTSGELANSQRIVKAQIADTAASMGKSLQPAFLALLKVADPVLGLFRDFVETPIGESCVVAAAGLGAIALAGGPVLIMLPTIITQLGMVGAAASTAWAAITGPAGMVVAAVAGIGAAIYALLNRTRHQREAGEKLMADLGKGILTDDSALEAMREQVAGLVREVRKREADFEKAGEDVAEAVARGMVIEEALEEEFARLVARIAALRREARLAKEAKGERSQLALEAENRLLAEQQRLHKLNIKIIEEENEGWLAAGQAYDLIQQERKAFAELEKTRLDNLRILEQLAPATQGLADVTTQLTKEQEKLTDTSRDLGKAQRDAADDIEDAKEQIEDSQEDIAEAHEDAAERIEDAAQRVRDAIQAEADARERARESIASAEERAAEEVERAQDRVAEAKKRLARIDEPELTKAQQRARQRQEAIEAVKEAEEALQKVQVEGPQAIAKAREDATKQIEAATRRVQEAQAAQVKAVKDARKDIEDAYDRREKAIERLADVEERAAERIVKAMEKVRRAKVAAGVEVPPAAAAVAPTAAAPMTVRVRPAAVAAGAPVAAYTGGWAAGPGRQQGGEAPTHVYIHLEDGLVAKHIGSPGGRRAVVRVIKDQGLRTAPA